MKKRHKPIIKFPISTLVSAFVFTCCFNSLTQESGNGSIDFIFKPGDSYNQIVIWVEDETGEYFGTVFITNFIGRRGGGNRTSDTDIDLSTGNRLSALPVWSYKRGVIDNTYGIENYYPPASTQPSYPDDIDAVSGATPNTNQQKKTWQFSDLSYGDYKCWVDVNKSFDVNDDHNYSYYRGQPSVLWETTIAISGDPDTNMVLDYAGYGSPDGSDGDINAPDMTITTATDLLSDMGGCKFKVIYTPQAVSTAENNYVHLPRHSCCINQNYPNPFISSTLISYSIYKSDRVIVKVYDIHGKEVQTLVDRFHEAGDYSVNFSTNNLPAGNYLYKFRVGNDLIDTKKMLLFK